MIQKTNNRPGGIATLSILSIPNLALPARRPASTPAPSRPLPGTPPAHLTHQWLDVYTRARVIFPGICAASSIANGYLAWVLRKSPGLTLLGLGWSTCYVSAITTTMSIAPFTILVMSATNSKLEEHARRDDAAVEEGMEQMKLSDQEKAKRAREDVAVPGLLQTWSKLNLVRAVFPLVGAVIALSAAVSL